MHPTISREPVQVAEIQNKVIKHYKDRFQNVLHRAQSRRILFLSLIGGYQQGKSSTAALITGNDGHVIGNGVDEQTRGVWIDGPVSFSDIAHRFNFPIEHDKIKDDPAIFLLDCEGAGGFRQGDNEEQTRMLIQQLEIPFISLSTVALFLAHKNESIESIENVSSLLNLEACSLDFDEACQKSMTLMPLFKNMGKYGTIDYRHPCLNNYKLLTQQLEITWLPRFTEKKYQFVPRPLPRFDDDDDVFHQSNDFYSGFSMVMHDVLNIFIGSLNGFNIHSEKEIFELYSKIVDSPINKSIEKTIQNLKLNAAMRNIQNITNGNITEILKTIDAKISEFITKKQGQWAKIDINEIEQFGKQCLNQSDTMLEKNLPPKYFNLPFVKDMLNSMHQNINNKINNLSKQLITELSPKIVRHITRQLNELGDKRIQEVFELISTVEGFNKFSNEKQQRINNIEFEIKNLGKMLCDINAKSVDDITDYVEDETNNCINRIKSAIFSELSAQESNLSTKEPEVKTEDDPEDPNMIIRYVRYIVTLPNGVRREEPWKILIREPKVYKTQVTVEKRQIKLDRYPYYSNQERTRIQTSPNAEDIYYTEWRIVPEKHRGWCQIC